VNIRCGLIHLVAVLWTQLLNRWNLILNSEDWRESFVSIVHWDLSQYQLHRLVLSQASSHSLVLEQLVIALKILSVAICLEDKVVILLSFQLDFVFFVHLPQDVLDKFLG
jgi:hypothetical protein